MIFQNVSICCGRYFGDHQPMCLRQAASLASKFPPRHLQGSVIIVQKLSPLPRLNKNNTIIRSKGDKFSLFVQIILKQWPYQFIHVSIVFFDRQWSIGAWTSLAYSVTVLLTAPFIVPFRIVILEYVWDVCEKSFPVNAILKLRIGDIKLYHLSERRRR